jgi:cobalt-precorrin-5B (C1)-methyltransferase
MSAGAVLGLARAANVPLAQRVARDAQRVAAEIAGPAIALDVLVVDRAGELIGQAGP